MLKWIRLVAQCLGDLISINHWAKKYTKEDKAPLTERHDKMAELCNRANKHGLHCEFLIEGKENIPSGQCLFVANHFSMMDPIIMLAVSDRPLSYLAKAQIKHYPVIKWIITASKGEFLDREDLRSEIKNVQNACKLIQSDNSVSFMVFPEGTRAVGPNFEVGPFHAGTFKVATRNELPVVPISVYLTERIIDQRYHYKKYPMQIIFHKPIMPDEYENLTTTELANKARDVVVEGVNLEKSKDRQLVKDLNHYSDKKVDKVLLKKGKNKKC